VEGGFESGDTVLDRHVVPLERGHDPLGGVTLLVTEFGVIPDIPGKHQQLRQEFIDPRRNLRLEFLDRFPGHCCSSRTCG